MPGLLVQTAVNVQVIGNYVHNNDHVNFAPQGKLAALLRPGTGILVLGLGADQVAVAGNTVVHNNFVDVGVGAMPSIADLRFV